MQFDPKHYPSLHAGNHRDVISTPDSTYNCIAWAVGINNDWWGPGPGETWPGNAPRGLAGVKITALVIVFESEDFKECSDGSLEEGIEKVGIYAIGPEWMHAARQLDTGKWTSKMGVDELIEHDTPHDLEGPWCGQIVKYMQRQRTE